MERYVPFTEGEFYHLYNRGVNKQNIFFSAGDWRHFQRLLFFCNNDSSQKINLQRLKNKPLSEIKRPKTLVDICAYAMMTNHFHLLVHEKKAGGVTTFMRKLMTSFAMYMNKKYERSGPLMCRPFRSKHVDSDEYFQTLFSYIHLNPLDQIQSDWKENGIKNPKFATKFLQEYQYSSYQDYFSENRDESIIVNTNSLPFCVNELKEIQKMIEQIKMF